jgi:uncharacterized protein (DUF1810 family)
MVASDEPGDNRADAEPRFERFVRAQAGCYAAVVDELRNGRKRTHWMWYIFPQLRGLGFSSTSHYYGIESLEDARAYLEHPLLGARLLECVSIVNGVRGRSAKEILGTVDAAKLRSSATLFQAAGGGSEFEECLERFFSGQRDENTLALLRTRNS